MFDPQPHVARVFAGALTTPGKPQFCTSQFRFHDSRIRFCLFCVFKGGHSHVKIIVSVQCVLNLSWFLFRLTAVRRTVWKCLFAHYSATTLPTSKSTSLALKRSNLFRVLQRKNVSVKLRGVSKWWVSISFPFRPTSRGRPQASPHLLKVDL